MRVKKTVLSTKPVTCVSHFACTEEVVVFFLHHSDDTEIDFLESCLNGNKGHFHVCQVHCIVDQQFSKLKLCRYIELFHIF